MDQKTKEQLQKKDKEGLLTFLGVLSKQAEEQKKKLKAEAEKWKAEAEKWQAEAERLAQIAPPNPYEPPLLRMRGGRVNMSEAEVDKEATEGRIFRVKPSFRTEAAVDHMDIDEDHGLPSNDTTVCVFPLGSLGLEADRALKQHEQEKRMKEFCEVKFTARLRVEELKTEIKDVEARLEKALFYKKVAQKLSDKMERCDNVTKMKDIMQAALDDAEKNERELVDKGRALDALLIDTMHISNFGYKPRPDNYSSAGRGAGP
jgi:DNA repair exonuclease SbcCD ATPase subunit